MWFKDNGDRSLGRELHGLKQEPGDNLVAEVAGKVGAGRSHVRSRAAFAGAMVTVVLGTFASFGGVGYAASGATNTVHSIVSISAASKVQTSARDQYKKKGSTIQKVSAKRVTVVRKSHPAVVATKATTLPFTGFSLGLTLALSFGLVILGFALRRRESRN